ncbi:VWA domain-containing protein [Streptomyces sp. NPDC048172]|uniref:vWA domain-containing protein n=1 Tax=Streptomyces sp. NPDC048172 TaxID=3365505 RepID=UPI003713DB4F
MRRTAEVRKAGVRTAGRWAVAATAAALLAAGCSGGGGTDSADHAEKGGSRPAPDAKGPGGGYVKEGPRGEQDAAGESGESGEPSRRPDFRSTFALDVDTASYSYARRTLKSGRLPAPGTVRTEEFVNSFQQDYARPEGNGFAVSADGARTTRPGWSLMRVGLATQDQAPEADRPPAALTFVLDVSGSMAEPGRLDLAKKALGMAADQLRAEDSAALVTFSGTAKTVLPMTRLGGGGRERLREAVRGLEPQQDTNLGAGVTRGYEEAADGIREGGTNRVVLLSDALANTGSTDAGSILEKVSENRKKHGITLFGVGVGSDYGDDLMERLTNRGDGHTAYVSGEKEAREVFVDQLPRNVVLRARDAKAQVTFDRDTVDGFRLLGYENRRVADDDFRNDSVDGGEIGPGHTVTALYAVRLKDGAEGNAARATVRWQDPKTRAPHERTRRIGVGALTGDGLWGENAEGTPPRLRLAAVAAYFAHALRADAPGPALPGAPSLRELRDEARGLAKETGDGAVSTLAEAIDRADGLT